ncbi:hypothetical protein [Chelatococcus asaccharovorans]|uniref:hypothetical protein n=1 Tax=Chelatococcus asaccharovorans TaxID=28210 RepID=UPI00226450F7|nr:hypothetical protein [Chelatococcus asaccharovorans]
MRPIIWLLTGILALAVDRPCARADETAIGANITFERLPDDFAATRGTDVEVNASHTFDNKLIVGGLAKYYDTISSDSSHAIIQITIGYAWSLGDYLTLTANGGIGGHLQLTGSGNDFPYYVFDVGLDVPVTDLLTWNLVSVRYRNAFDTSNDFETPAIATGFSIRLDKQNSISVKIERDWSDGSPEYTGVQIGYTYRF